MFKLFHQRYILCFALNKHSTKSNEICDFFVVTMLLDNIYADCTHEKHVKNEIDYLQFSQHLASVHQYMGH